MRAVAEAEDVIAEASPRGTDTGVEPGLAGLVPLRVRRARHQQELLHRQLPAGIEGPRLHFQPAGEVADGDDLAVHDPEIDRVVVTELRIRVHRAPKPLEERALRHRGELGEADPLPIGRRQVVLTLQEPAAEDDVLADVELLEEGEAVEPVLIRLLSDREQAGTVLHVAQA